MYNNTPNNFEYDECIAKGICSIHPSISALEEVILLIIKQSAYYILKLKELNINTKQAENTILCMLTSVISGASYSDEKLLSIISTSYKYHTNLREKYIEVCNDKDIKYQDLKLKIKISPDMSISNIISIGEKIFKSSTYNTEKKYIIDLINILIKNTALNLIRYSEYISTEAELIKPILEALNIQNHKQASLSKYYKKISELSEINHAIQKECSKYFVENYGEITKTEVDFSSSKGKAILVSGKSLSDLYNLLEYTKDKNIDIYTHDDLLMAHAYQTFKSYKNLKGQFGSCTDKCVLDFSTFPGAILLTKQFSMNLEYLYRGRLFTTAQIIPKGITGITDNNFEYLVKSATESKGFAKGQKRAKKIVGYNKKELITYLKKISLKILNREIENIFVLYPTSNFSSTYEKLISKLTDKDFVLNFNDNEIKNIKNSITINLSFNNRMINEVLEYTFKSLKTDKSKYRFYFVNCDYATISDIIYYKTKGFSKLHLSNCTPNTINPGLHKFITKLYDIEKY